jgi:hypothetical protein
MGWGWGVEGRQFKMASLFQFRRKYSCLNDMQKMWFIRTCGMAAVSGWWKNYFAGKAKDQLLKWPSGQ